LVGLDAAAFMGVPVTTVATGLAAGAAAMIADRVAQLKDKGEISDKKGYFLWKLQAAQAKKA